MAEPGAPAGSAMRGDRIPSLDGLRAISITLVLLSHLLGTAGFFLPLGIIQYIALGDLGVRVFFVISGFLITNLLLSEAAANSWYVGHTWSLSVEEQFYLLWPALLVVLGGRRAFWAAALFVLAAPLIRLGLWDLTVSARDGVGDRFETVADAIAVGCLLAGARMAASAAGLPACARVAVAAAGSAPPDGVAERPSTDRLSGGLHAEERPDRALHRPLGHRPHRPRRTHPQLAPARLRRPDQLLDLSVAAAVPQPERGVVADQLSAERRPGPSRRARLLLSGRASFAAPAPAHRARALSRARPSRPTRQPSVGRSAPRRSVRRRRP